MAKLFVPEAGTAELNAMLPQPDMEIWGSELARLEFYSLAWRRCGEGSLDTTQVTSLLAELDQQLDAWQVIELTPVVPATARELLAAHAALHQLRTLDAIQPASFMAALEEGGSNVRLCRSSPMHGGGVSWSPDLQPRGEQLNHLTSPP